MSAQEYKAPESVGRLEKRALVVGVLGLVVSIVGWITKPEDFFRSYLVAFLLVLGLSLGSLGLLMLQHLTGGHWGILIRRPLEPFHVKQRVMRLRQFVQRQHTKHREE